MKSRRARLALPGVLLLLCVPAALRAQTAAPPDSLLRRIFASRDFASDRFGPAGWVEGGRAYTTVEPSTVVPGGSDIVRYEASTGERSVLVPAARLVPAGASA